jgi:hypothetical protein
MGRTEFQRSYCMTRQQPILLACATDFPSGTVDLPRASTPFVEPFHRALFLRARPRFGLGPAGAIKNSLYLYANIDTSHESHFHGRVLQNVTWLN